MKNYYIVTGASSGIGFALCQYLAKRNKTVVAIARRDEQLSILKKSYPQLITTITADLSTPAGREDVTKHVADFGTLSGLVNNAATIEPLSLLQDLSLAEWHKQIAINIDAPVFLTQSLLPFMKNARIMNITSAATNYVASGSASYAMTKAAINRFTKYLSEELKNKGILVTAAHPGAVKTDMVNNIIKPNNTDFDIYKAQEKFQKENAYLDVNLPAKFLGWLLLDADDSLYTGDVIGIYNKQYQSLWHDEEIPSPYAANITTP